MSAARSSVYVLAWMFPLGAMLGGDLVCAQDFPTKQVRVITSEAGGGSDLPARVLTQGLTPIFGQPIVIENRGGGPITAADAMQKAAPDGYTLLFYGNSLWTLPLMRTGLNYDMNRDYAPISMAIVTPEVLVVHPSLPVKSVTELIAFIKARPGQLNNSSASGGSANNLAAELFKSMAGLNMVRIAYKGHASALNAVAGGEVQVFFPVVGPGMQLVKTGRLRALAVTSAQPTSLAPGIPTVASSGLPGYVSVFTAGMFAPAGTPAAIISKLNRDISQVLQRPEVKEKLFGMGMDAMGGSPQEFAAALKDEMTVMGKVIKERNIRDD